MKIESKLFVLKKMDGFFCSIYDGFNGRDAAEFLASTLYENIRLYLNMLDSQMKHHSIMFLNNSDLDGSHWGTNPDLSLLSYSSCLPMNRGGRLPTGPQG